MNSKLFLIITFLQILCFIINGNYIDWKYCVIGSGPAGLQIGYFLQQKHRNYIIFEKDSSAGSFFKTFPRHDTLISINKRYTGEINQEFNMRHDWNSLLTDDFSTLFKNFSKEYFPSKNDLYRYLNHFGNYWNLKIQFNTTMSRIKQMPDKRFTMNDQNGMRYRCHLLIIATGLSSPYIPDVRGIEFTIGYEHMNLSLEHYEGKDVLILGKGNSAFEVAHSIHGVTNFLTLASNSQVRLAWATHYVGDLRAINNNILDNYQLKSLDGILEVELHSDIIKFEKCNKTNKINVFLRSIDRKSYIKYHKSFDIVIRCTGWKFDWDIFDKDTLPGSVSVNDREKFPKIQADYNSVEFDNLYFAGTNTHSIDFRKSAGGFIHGFRYTTRSLHRLMEYRHHGIKWPHTSYSLNSIVNHFIRRINEGSGIYQMFSNLGDIAIINEEDKSYYFVEEYPILRLADFELNTGIQVKSKIIVFVFEYGRDFSKIGGDPFSENRIQGTITAAHLSNFLHPVIYVYNKLPKEEQIRNKGVKDILPKPNYQHHIKEDFHTNWRIRESAIFPFQRFMENVLKQDFSTYSAETCLGLILTQNNYPVNCDINFKIVLSK